MMFADHLTGVCLWPCCLDCLSVTMKSAFPSVTIQTAFCKHFKHQQRDSTPSGGNNVEEKDKEKCLIIAVDQKWRSACPFTPMTKQDYWMSSFMIPVILDVVKLFCEKALEGVSEFASCFLCNMTSCVLCVCFINFKRRKIKRLLKECVYSCYNSSKNRKELVSWDDVPQP